MRLVMAFLVLVSLAAPALAQTQRLPRKSSSERTVDDINRSIIQEERSLRRQQQQQIDNNQLRQRVDRQQMFTNPPQPNTLRRFCPPGSVGC
ncbi:hypothetical protein [Microvirga flavescens]|uniref:hypothetical protein n=1 Tax=Microvirga flavescens TaxID=2249811 RepID=UPI000DD8F422|nr:hypothetical protein [Microvirga flavescens]